MKCRKSIYIDFGQKPVEFILHKIRLKDHKWLLDMENPFNVVYMIAGNRGSENSFLSV